MHLVGAGLQPLEEALRAVPDALAPVSFAVDDPLAMRGGELPPWPIERHPALARELLQILLALPVRLGLPGTNGTAAQGLVLIRNHEPVVDADRASEAAAALART